MYTGRKIPLFLTAVVLSILLASICPQQGQCSDGANNENSLVGRWEIYQTKAPGRAYDARYKGRSFVSTGPHAYTVIYQYNPDGTFQRTTKIDGKDIPETGKWTYSGNAMKLQLDKGREDEVFYVRFDDQNQITVVEVYEGTSDPGMFAQFRRIK